MKRRITRSVAVFGVLILAAVVILTLPDKATVTPASAAGSPTLELTGVLHDFRASHPDFDSASAELGHHAGIVKLELAGGRPVFTGAGYEVASQWLDDAGRPIAPHLYSAGGAGDPGGGGSGSRSIRADGAISLDKSVLDSFDSSLGPYGPGNMSGDVVLSTNSTAADTIAIDSDSIVIGDVLVGPGGSPASVIDNAGTITGSTGVLAGAYPMPVIVPPTDAEVGPSVGDVWYKNAETVTLTGNMHTQNLRVSTDAIVTVSGNVKILVEGDFTTETEGAIIVEEGSSLDIFVLGDVTLKTKSAWSDPRNTRLWVIGTPQIKIETEAAFYGVIYAPDTKLLMKTKAQVFGGFVGKELEGETESTIHVDRAGTQRSNLAVTGKISAKDPGTIFDGYDSSAGPYGGANSELPIVVSTNATSSNIVDLSDTTVTGDVLVGPGGDPSTAIKTVNCTVAGILGALDEPVTMSPVLPPVGLGPNVGDVTYTGVSTLSSDLRCDKLVVDSGVILEIDGNVTIYCESEFKLAGPSEVRLLPDATLDLYVVQDFKIENGSKFNANTADPSRAREYHINPGSDNIKIDGGSECHAMIRGPGSSLTVASASQFFGNFLGGEVKNEGGSGIHIDLAGNQAPECLALDDVAGLAGAAGNAAIASSASFDQWYRDVLGTNLSRHQTIVLTDDGSGVFEHLTSSFHPVDGRALGNDGDDHNYYFTYEITAQFTYEPCTGQFIEFEGDDDAWMFVDGQLVMELAGQAAGESQYVEVDRLGLEAGQVAQLRFFYAQRQESSASFNLRTNIALQTSTFLSGATEGFD